MIKTMEELERAYEDLRPEHSICNLHSMTLEQLNTLLCYELWQDGMDWTLVQKILTGEDRFYTDKNTILDFLEKLGY